MGERVQFSGFSGAPDAIVNPKKLAKALKDLHFNDQGVAQVRRLRYQFVGPDPNRLELSSETDIFCLN